MNNKKKKTKEKNIATLPQHFVDEIAHLIINDYLPAGFKNIIDKNAMSQHIAEKLENIFYQEVEIIRGEITKEYALKMEKQQKTLQKEIERLKNKREKVKKEAKDRIEKTVKKKKKMELPRLPKSSHAKLFMEEDMNGNWLRYTRPETDEEMEQRRLEKRLQEREEKIDEEDEMQREALIAIPHKSQMSLW